MRTYTFVKHSIVAGIVTILGCNTNSSQAAVLNGGFERGFSGYTTIGDTIVHSGSFKSKYGNGKSQAVISNTPGAEVDFTFSGKPSVSNSALEQFLGLNSGSLDAIASNIAIEGSAIKQTFFGNANDTLSFDFGFLTDEDTLSKIDFNKPNPQYNDFAFFTLQFEDSSSYVFQLADTFSDFTNSYTTPFIYETGIQTKSLSLAAAGQYTVGFGVLDVGDENFASSLLVDNIKLTSNANGKPVPVPSSVVALAMFGFSAFGTYIKRSKQKLKA